MPAANQLIRANETRRHSVSYDYKYYSDARDLLISYTASALSVDFFCSRLIICLRVVISASSRVTR
jgi:hypothetical protein